MSGAFTCIINYFFLLSYCFSGGLRKEEKRAEKEFVAFQCHRRRMLGEFGIEKNSGL